MASVNAVTLIGRVGKDPETRHMTNGDAVCSLSLATSETWKDKATGEKKERVEWHRLQAFKKTAELIGKYVQKGSLLYVEGKITYRDWEDKDGTKRQTTEIVVNEIQFLDAKPKGQKAENYRPPESQRAPEPTPADDDTPF